MFRPIGSLEKPFGRAAENCVCRERPCIDRLNCTSAARVGKSAAQTRSEGEQE
jgi:hypothetical protein